MTKQQPNKQNIRRYRYHTDSIVMYPIARRKALSQQEERPEQQRTYVAPNVTERRVTTPHQAIQPLSWAERHARLGHRQAQQTPPGRLVSRTFAQTGMPAPVGQRRTSRPLSRQRADSAVPVRRKRGIVHFLRRLFGFLLVLAVIGGGIDVALTNPTFHVQQVNIEGTQNAGLIAAIQQMGIQGQDIFLLHQAELLQRLETLPLVRSAHLDIQLPNRVTVTIQERIPVLLWQYGHTVYGLDQDGTIIAPASALSETHSLATVVDKRQGVSLHPGTHIDMAQIAFAQQLIQQLPGIEGVAPFSLQYVDHILVHGQSEPANQAGAGCYIVISAHGWQAYMGDAVNSNSLANRLLELQQILRIAQQQHIQLATIDLRFGLHPTYTVQ